MLYNTKGYLQQYRLLLTREKERRKEMDIKRIVSLKWRVDKIIRAYNEQTFENGQRYLTGEQLAQLYNIKDVVRLGNLPCPYLKNNWSIHNMVQIQNYLDAQILSLQLGCLYD